MDGKEKIELILITGTGGMLLLALLVIGFIVVYQRKMFAKQRELVLKDLETQKKLVKAEIQVKEREQKRVAQELHDEIGASLTAIRFLFEQLQDSEKVKLELKNSLKDVTQKVRRISNDLLPSVLEEFGLLEAIRDFAQRFDQNQHVKVLFQYQNYSITTLKKDIELSLYRLVQELTNNIMKHAEATEIKIILSNNSNAITISIIDNGNGIIPTMNNSAKTLGLKNIESRLQYINGSLKREPNTPKGTIVTLKKPLP